jgi:hypothetical protein
MVGGFSDTYSKVGSRHLKVRSVRLSLPAAYLVRSNHLLAQLNLLDLQSSLPGPLSSYNAPQKLPKCEDEEDPTNDPNSQNPQTPGKDKGALMGPHRRTKSAPVGTLLYCPRGDEGPEGPKASTYLQSVPAEEFNVRPKEPEVRSFVLNWWDLERPVRRLRLD